MMTARLILAYAFLAFAALFAVMNWVWLFQDLNNKRRGIDRHVSMVPVVSVIVTLWATLTHPGDDDAWMMIVPLLDIGNWSLLLIPVVLIRGWLGWDRETPTGTKD